MAEGAPIANAEGQEDKTLRGGDVRVTKVEVWDSHHAAPWDLTSIWKNISIFEDIETNYIRADCEEEVKEKAVCGDILSNCDTEVFIDEIEVAERRK